MGRIRSHNGKKLPGWSAPDGRDSARFQDFIGEPEIIQPSEFVPRLRSREPPGCGHPAYAYDQEFSLPSISKWNGLDLDIEALYLAQRLWLVATIDVHLDGILMLSTKGQLKFTGSVSHSIKSRGSTHRMMLEWSRFRFRRVPCRLLIDDQVLFDGLVEIGDWQMAVIMQLLISVLILAVCSLVCFGQVLLSGS